MEPGEVAGWPRNRWELSAAETYALLYGPKTSKPSQPFKLAVLELVSWRMLELVEVEKSAFFRPKQVAVEVVDASLRSEPVESLLGLLGLGRV